MRLDFKQLKKIVVETQSGMKLGSVYDFVLETDGQMVVQYLVKHSLVSQETFRISRDQVISINDQKMIVDNGVMKEEKKFLERKKSVVRSGAVAMTRD